MKKTGIIITGIVLTGLLFFGFKKAKAGKEVLDNLKFKIKKVSNFNLQLPNISFDAIISVYNATNIDFGATLGSIIKVKKIKFYTPEGIFLGEATGNLEALNLPAQSSIDLPTVTVSLDSMLALQEFGSNLEYYLNQDFSRLKLKLTLEAFGNNITINV